MKRLGRLAIGLGRSLALWMTVLLVSAACSDGGGPDEEHRALATLDHTGPTIDAPSTVKAGQPFSVTLNTVAGCGIRAHSVDVNLESGGTVARLLPYNAVPGPNEVMPLILCMPISVSHIARSVALTLPRPGPAIIRAVGAQPSDPLGRDSLQIEVTVEP